MSSNNHKNESTKPVHVCIAENLRQNVLARLHPGMKLESEAELAPRLGVSVYTLRQALTVLAHEGLVERRHGSGTYVAENKMQEHVAIVTRFSSNVKDSSFQLRVFRTLGSLVQKHGYQNRFYVWSESSSDTPADFAAELERGRISGVVFVAMGPDAPLADSLTAKDVPFVVTSESFPHGVVIDYEAIVREGTRYLLEQGCRRIALMQWFSPGEAPMSTRSLQSFESELRKIGAASCEPWVRRTIHPDQPGAGWEQFREILAARDIKPDGLLVTDDILFRDVALGILDSRIQVPDQLRVITHANKGSGLSYPFPVASLEIDPQEFAETLAGMLVRLTRKETVSPPTLYVPPRLVPAGSRIQATVANRKTENTVS